MKYLGEGLKSLPNLQKLELYLWDCGLDSYVLNF